MASKWKEIMVVSFAVSFFVACGGGGHGNTSSGQCARGEPSIAFTHVPLIRSFDVLKGVACNVSTSDYAVATCINVDGDWWPKPYYTQPTVRINGDGKWSADITTGGIDERATEICSYIVSANYRDTACNKLDANSIAKVCTIRTAAGTATPVVRTSTTKPSPTLVKTLTPSSFTPVRTLTSAPTATQTSTPKTAVVCPGEQVGDPSSISSIEIVSTQSSRISGTTENVNGATDRVVCYAITDCAYIQPDIYSWGVSICSDGSWNTATYPWGRLICLVVDKSTFTHPSKVCTSRDSELCELPGVKACALYPPARTISFSGSDWVVKDSSGYLMGPGPNVFSAGQNNVTLNTEGTLSLRTVQNGDQWSSSEIIRTEAAGYGIYECRISSRLNNLDSYVVVSCFTYEDQKREIDFIECSPSFIQDPQNCQYVVQPWTTAGNIHRFTMPDCLTSTHRMVWLSDQIKFTSWCGHDPYPPDPSLIVDQWTYTGPDIPPSEGRERAHGNLWRFNGHAPAGDGDTELILNSFDVP